MKTAKLFTYKNYFAVATVEKKTNHVFVSWFIFDGSNSELAQWDNNSIELEKLSQKVFAWVTKSPKLTLWSY